MVYKLDRLTRNLKDLVDLVDIFQKYQCDFNSFMENIDTQTASGKLFVNVVGSFAQYERETTMERVKLACEKKVKEGYTLGYFTTSYGYDRAVGEKIQTVNPEEAEIVKEIYAMYVNGNMSYNAIAQNLNHRNIKPKLGKVWGHASVRSILINPNYIGKVRYATADKARYFEAEGQHEPIISDELYQEAQSRIGKIKHKSHTKRPKDDNYFSGTIFCGFCGAKLITHAEYKTTEDGVKVVNGGYRCPNQANGTCGNSRFSHRKAEAAFQEYMDNIPDITVPDDTVLEEKNEQERINALIREEVQNAIAKLEKKAKSVMKLYIGDEIPFDEYAQMNSIIASEKASYMERLENIPTDPDEDFLLTREEILTNFRDNWKLLTNAERLKFLQDHIEKITAVARKEEEHSQNKVKVLQVKFYPK